MRRSFDVFILLFVFFMLSCKKKAELGADSAMLLSMSADQVPKDCAVDTNSPLVQKLLNFSYLGVKPYVGCPFQTEWSLYPSFSVAGQSGEFQGWMKKTFSLLEQKSVVAGQDYFVDRYEFYTIALGEGLAFYFDVFANLKQGDVEEYKQRMQSVLQINQNPFSELFPLYNFLAERSFSRKSSAHSAEVRDFLVDPRGLPLYGFGFLGIDWFAAEFPQLRNRSYAKPYIGDFVELRDFFPLEVQNELNEKVKTAVFRNLESGLQAFAAVYLERRNMFLSDARQCQISIPQDSETRMYWTYYYFMRPDLAKKKMCSERSLRFYQASESEDGHRPQKIPLKLLKRLATRKFVSQEKVLD